MNKIINFIYTAPTEKVIKICGVSRGMVSHWRCGRYIPTARAVLDAGRYIKASKKEIFEALDLLESSFIKKDGRGDVLQ